jgi:hypothetical protein
MNAGTRAARTTVASITTASARPSPIIFTLVTSEVLNATSTIATSTAAAVMMGPVRCSPPAIERGLSRRRSYSSLMLLSMKTW